jgi:hypothetical protein
MVEHGDLGCIFDGPPAEEYDAYGEGYLTLVSLEEYENHQAVGLSYLVPRIYTLSDGPG